MSLNILINELVGTVPGIGDAFAFWFRSNVRNRRLLEAHLNDPYKPRRGDWIFVLVIVGGVLLFVVTALIVDILILRALLRLLLGLHF